LAYVKKTDQGKLNPNIALASEIWTTLRNPPYNVFKRDTGKKVVIKAIQDILDNSVSGKIDLDLDGKGIQRYNKAELLKDLIKQVKAGKADAARIIADINGYKNDTTDLVIVPMYYKDVVGLKADEIFEEYIEEKNKKTIIEGDDEDDV